MTLKAFWMALAIVGAGTTMAACEEETPLEEAAEEVEDAVDDAN